MLYLTKVPVDLLSQIKSGAAFVDGVLVKSRSSGQILAHLQQTAKLTEVLSGVGGVNPVATLSQLAQNVQLQQIHQMLGHLQIISTVGAAASVLNLGVNLVGFAVVLSRLRRIESRLDKIESKLDSVIKHQRRESRARLYTGLQAAEEAIWMKQQGARLHSLQTANERITDAFYGYIGDLSKRDSSAFSGDMALSGQPQVSFNSDLSLSEIHVTLSWVLFCAAARMEGLMLMGEYGAALKFSEQMAEWLRAVHVTPREFLTSRVKYMAGPGLLDGMIQEAKALSDFLEEERYELSQTIQVLEQMRRLDVDYVRYSREVREGEVQLLAMVYPS